MKVLAVGDIVGKVGIQKLKDCLPFIIEDKKIDFVIVNGENAADGMGLTEKNYQDILSCGADCVTMGNHTWGKKDIFKFIDHPQLIRPANYSPNNPGKGYAIFEKNGKKICVINLIGRVTMGVLSENPFLVAKNIINEVKNNVDLIIVDFHGEATAEKIAFKYYVDGDANIVFGTHTHVQTADETITEKGMGYITDIGMTGPKDSVIGMEIAASIKRFETSLPEKYKAAEGKGMFNSIMFELDDNMKVTNISRINK